MRADAHQLLRSVELAAEHGQHIHARHGFAFQQNGNVLAVHFYADRLFHGNGAGGMRRLIEHGSEAEKFARRRLIYDDLLMIFIHGSDANRCRRP